MISFAISLPGRISKGTSSNSIEEFSILKAFAVAGHVSKTPKIIQVNWYPHLRYWIKGNTDGAALGSPGYAACGALFRDKNGAILG